MRLAKSLIVFAAATVALAQDAIISRGFFIGVDTSLPGARGPEVFRNPKNHAIASASIVKYAASKVNYVPQSQPPSKTSDSYIAFKEKVRTFPGLREGDSYHLLLKLEGGASDLQDKIQQQYPFDNEASVARQLRYALPSFNKDTTLREWEVSLVLIRKPKDIDDRVTVELISLTLLLDTAQNGDVEIPEQHAKFVTKQYEMKTNVLVKNADRLFKDVGVTTISQFGLYFKSRPAQFPNIRDWYDNGKPFHDDEGCFDF
ncbi:hypothetical protein DFQ27_004355 [Actinomortierella ambigua]|uniref:Uncharacterized protein n=1 Tax=Actinomortierella ambigua TaxID=1343610 RepID=A0A9P6Q6B3_9FUNG|nr:hypothetical protein DFQ27_004355 [Actinomortierella ambigua]